MASLSRGTGVRAPSSFRIYFSHVLKAVYQTCRFSRIEYRTFSLLKIRTRVTASRKYMAILEVKPVVFKRYYRPFQICGSLGNEKAPKLERQRELKMDNPTGGAPGLNPGDTTLTSDICESTARLFHRLLLRLSARLARPFRYGDIGLVIRLHACIVVVCDIPSQTTVCCRGLRVYYRHRYRVLHACTTCICVGPICSSIKEEPKPATF